MNPFLKTQISLWMQPPFIASPPPPYPCWDILGGRRLRPNIPYRQANLFEQNRTKIQSNPIDTYPILKSWNRILLLHMLLLSGMCGECILKEESLN